MNTKFKIIFGTSIISLCMTAYITFMGTAANRASAIAVHEFSQQAIDNWYYVATNLESPLENTKAGDLSPLIPEQHAALDLVIYGYEIIAPEYQDFYRALDMPRMVEKLHIGINDKGQLQYNVGGVQLISIESQGIDSRGGAAFYLDTPFQLIDQASRLYDGVPAKDNADGEGVVRYDRLNDGRYVMGMFLDYTQPPG
ncbi:hypothetical protein [Microbulbifer epialgicus]|uniref:Uncharacterized protein n=1 Tax=Microbulbifer epialgicus TaxID=393907 RepID=A0ABV4NTQ8_9GAMM